MGPLRIYCIDGPYRKLLRTCRALPTKRCPGSPYGRPGYDAGCPDGGSASASSRPTLRLGCCPSPGNGWGSWRRSRGTRATGARWRTDGRRPPPVRRSSNGCGWAADGHWWTLRPADSRAPDLLHNFDKQNTVNIHLRILKKKLAPNTIWMAAHPFVEHELSRLSLRRGQVLFP